MNRQALIACLAGMVLALVPSAMAVTIQTVPVGNVGNAADMRYATPGYGAVDYTYNIGKYEVTAGQYCEFLNAVAASDTYGLYSSGMNNDYRGCQITQNGTDGNYTYDFSGGTLEAPGSTAADWAKRPVNFVSWGDAARFANWLHNGQPTGTQNMGTTEDGAYFLNGATSSTELGAVSRETDWKWAIPTEDEWYKAAYHKNDGNTGNYFDYPTSNDSVPSNDLLHPDPGNNATFHDTSYTIGNPYYRTEVGDHENSDSPYGTFDQCGNVSEWTEAEVSETVRWLRGGAFYDGAIYGHAATRLVGGSSYGGVNVGFRVSEIPEPYVIPEPLTMFGIMLGVGGLAGYIRGRRSRKGVVR